MSPPSRRMASLKGAEHLVDGARVLARMSAQRVGLRTDTGQVAEGGPAKERASGEMPR